MATRLSTALASSSLHRIPATLGHAIRHRSTVASAPVATPTTAVPSLRTVPAPSSPPPTFHRTPKFARTHPLDAGFCCGFHRTQYLAAQRRIGMQQEQQLERGFSSPAASGAIVGDPVFSVELSPIRFGRGALHELGAACVSQKMKRIMLLSDRNIVRLAWYQEAVERMRAAGVEVIEYNETSIEPTLQSMMHAAAFAKDAKVDGFVSIGGGSVIDTAKAANLYSCAPPKDDDPLVYVNAPIGRGLFPATPLKPHIACPTTAGTGSETTGIAIFDHEAMGVKTGIAHKGLRPTLALIDPTTQESIPPTVCASSGFDVLSHALESYTAKSHLQRATTARTPEERFNQRPMSQGANVWADHGCLSALRILGQALLPAYEGDAHARDEMMLASTMAGIAFGNVGVHLPHAMSYAVSGGVREFRAPDYNLSEGAIVPHGMSVILNAPAVFRHTASTASSPLRHYYAARALGVPAIMRNEIRPSAPAEVIGEALAEHLVALMRATNMPNGLRAVGFTPEANDLKQLVAGTMQQQRLLNNLETPIDASELETIFKDAMDYW